MDWDEFRTHYDTLAGDVGIDGELFREVVLWALIEERIERLVPPSAQLKSMIQSRNGFDKYRTFVEQKTGREWEFECIQVHWDRARKAAVAHGRHPISFEDKLRLFFNSPRECRYCHKTPPEVRLHIDHKEPASMGGDSTIHNLQFLCQDCNLSKGARLKREDFFDRYLC